MSFKAKIDGEVFELSDDYKKIMEYFSNAQAIDKTKNGEPIQITTMTKEIFNQLKKACQIAKFDFPTLPNCKTNDLKQYLGNPHLASYLDTFDNKKINELFRGANFLQMKKLQKCIAAAVACRVYHKPTLDGYKNKKAQLKIKYDMNSLFSKKMKSEYAFMN